MSHLYKFLLLCLFAISLPAQTTKVLLVGDSWADFMWADRSLRDLFAAHGHADTVEKGDITAISGSTAAEWVSPQRLQLISEELAAHPEIEIVQLTLGGNDFLNGQSGGGWYLGMSSEEEDAFFERVADDIHTVIGHILAQTSQVEVLLSFYDYPNFRESLSGLLFLFCNNYWNDLGQPTTAQINEVFARFMQRMAARLASLERVSMVDHMGRMQHHFGFPSEGIEPGELLPPGNPALPSPPEAMRFGGNDCIHVSAAGHAVIAENLWQAFYQYRFCVREEDWWSSLSEWPAEPITAQVERLSRLCP